MDALLRITDGTTVIDLLEEQEGFILAQWQPGIIEPKDGGIWADSKIADGRRRVAHVNTNAVDTFTVRLRAASEDAIFDHLQDLRALLAKAVAYWEVYGESSPVWVEAKGADETNTRYAIIKDWRVAGEIDIFSNPFVQPDGNGYVIPSITIAVERGDWQDLPPGEYSSCELSQSYTWQPTLSNWSSNMTGLSGTITAMLRLASPADAMLAGGYQYIYRSVNYGSTWATTLSAGTGQIRCFLEAANGYVYAGDEGQILRSTDHGATWAVNKSIGASRFVVSIIQLPDGTLIALDDNSATLKWEWVSTDNGASWTLTQISDATFYPYRDSMVGSDGCYYVVGAGGALYKIPNWQTRAGMGLLQVGGGGSQLNLIWESSSHSVFAFSTYSGKLYRSTDFYDYGWTSSADKPHFGVCLITTAVTADPDFYYQSPTIAEDANGHLYFGWKDGAGNSIIYRSDNGGATWYLTTTLNASSWFSSSCRLLAHGENIFMGENTRIYKLNITSSDEMTVGTTTPTVDDILVSNRSNYGNITHIFIDDGGTFGANLYPMTTSLVAGVSLFPAVPAANDAIYFGAASGYNAGTFNSLVFDIGTIMSGTYTLVWEYWTGAAWATLTVVDDTESFSAAGIHKVTFSGLGATTVNSVTAYWVRARLSAVTGTVTPPTQIDNEIYSIMQAWVEIGEDAIGGDLPARGIIQLSYAGSSFNRAIMGVRTVSRGELFNAFLPFSDTQLRNGLSLTLGADSSYAAEVTSSTGRAVSWLASSVTWQEIASIVLDPSLAMDYYGTFQAYMRMASSGITPGEYYFRLKITNGSGGMLFYTDQVQPVRTTSEELISLGRVNIPGGAFLTGEYADSVVFTIEGRVSAATTDVSFNDLVLMPVDEWAGDFIIPSLSATGAVDATGGIARYLEVDSIVGVKFGTRATVRKTDATNSIVAAYQPVSNGPVSFSPKKDQRIWFLTMTGSSSGYFYAPITNVASVSVKKVQRYYSGRGLA